YRLLTRSLMQATAELCAGKLVLAHEGGYSAPYVPFCGLAVLEELSAIKTPCDDPLLAYHQAIGGQDLQPHQAEYIQRAARLLAHLG
ncbi:MAG: class II histone deacetylase, partial [Candidatus Competibacteraceae bacterium]|nr:class II histone deacetylase [Candidatus Competibacteraceae bacterium]